MNLNTLAGLCGVSAATVSKAFSGSNEISEETRQKIFDIAKQYGVYDRYNKNKYNKKVIAVICPELNSDYYNKYITLLDKEISALDGIMTVSVSNFDSEREYTLMSYYSSYCKADGIITVGQQCKLDAGITIPVFAISPSKQSNVDSAIINSGYMLDVIEHLKNNGHTEIGFVGEKLTMTTQNRFKEAMRSKAMLINDDYIKTSSLRFEEAGIQVMDSWFEQGVKLPTAIVAAYDYIAIGIIKSIQRHGLSVPDDISVVGADDINVANYLETPLSTVKSNAEYICRKAAEIIMKMIKNPYYSEKITVPSEFVPRETSGKAKG